MKYDIYKLKFFLYNLCIESFLWRAYFMRKNCGIFGIIIGLLSLSAELYSLKIIQSLEMVHGQWRTNAWGYLQEPQCLVAVVITAAVIVYSCYLTFSSK